MFYKLLKMSPHFAGVINVKRKYKGAISADDDEDDQISSSEIVKIFYEASIQFNEYFT